MTATSHDWRRESELLRRGLIVYLWIFTTGLLFSAPLDAMGFLPARPLLVILILTVALPVPVALASVVRAARRRSSTYVPPTTASARAESGFFVALHWLWAGLGLFALWSLLYFLGNTLAAERPFAAQLFVAIDRRMPFLPSTVLVYFTVYWIFLIGVFNSASPHESRSMVFTGGVMVLISSATHVVFPVELPRPSAELTSFAAWALSTLHQTDNPVSCFPSTHCAMAMFAALATLFRGQRRLGVLLVMMTVVVGVSTLTTRQHYALDVVGGYLLAGWAFVAHVWTMIHSPETLRPPQS